MNVLKCNNIDSSMLCKIVKEVNFLELSRKYILFENKSMIKIYYHII